MRLTLALLGLLASLSSSLPAYAEEESTKKNSAELETSFNVWISREPNTSVMQTQFSMQPIFLFRDRLTLAPILHVTSMNIDLHGKKNVPFDVTLSLPPQLSLGGKIGFKFLTLDWFSITAQGEFEFPLSENRAEITELVTRDELTKVPLSLETVQNHVMITHEWRRISFNLRLAANVDWWTPFVDVGFLSNSGRLAVTFDPAMNALLNTTKVTTDRFYDTSQSSPYYMLGSIFNIGGGFKFSLKIALLPSSDKIFFAGEGGITIPLNLLY